MKDTETLTFREYHPLALRTESPVPPFVAGKAFEGTVELNGTTTTKKWRLDHAVHGLQSEIHEFFDSEEEVNYLEEYGDCFWYLNLLCDALGTTIDELMHEEIPEFMDCAGAYVAACSRLSEQYKRHVFYPEEFKEEKWLEQATKIKAILIQACDEVNLDPEEVLATNIRKLKARQPGKFSTEAALNRNLEKEKEALYGQDL